MLARYQIVRGVPASKLPRGIRQDTRKHTRHCLRPSPELVARFLDSPDDATWERFARDYRSLLRKRLDTDRGPFDELATLAMTEDVLRGCNCPTQKNPDVRHCHTWLALEFMREVYPDLPVRMPEP